MEHVLVVVYIQCDTFHTYGACVNSLTSNCKIFPVTSSRKFKVLKILFMSSSDLFGRITIYKLDVLGC